MSASDAYARGLASGRAHLAGQHGEDNWETDPQAAADFYAGQEDGLNDSELLAEADRRLRIHAADRFALNQAEALKLFHLELTTASPPTVCRVDGLDKP